MKKTLLILASLLILALVLIYTLLFTSPGNDILKPYIETKINEYSPAPVKLDTFSLSTDTIKAIIKLDDKNSILAQGNYSIFDQSFDIDYTLLLSKLSSLNPHLQRSLKGKLHTKGNLVGDLKLFKIKGESDIALSDTQYAIVLKDMEVDKAAIKLTKLNMKTLLNMLGEKPYIKGKLDLHVQLNDLNPEHMQGAIDMHMTQAKLNAKVLKDEFGLHINKTSLKAAFKATLKQTDITYTTKIDSELAKINSKGNIKADRGEIDGSYYIDIKELALLKSITKAPFRGPFSTSGKIQGSKQDLIIKGKSDLAHSQTEYSVSLKDFNPRDIRMNIKKARLEKLLYLVGEPKYAEGVLDLNAQLTSLEPLTAELTLSITKGLVNNKQIKKSYDLSLPKTIFDLISKVKIQKDTLNAKSKLTSNLATVKMKNSELNIKTSALKSDYSLSIPSLKKLEPILDKKLYGKIDLHGEIKKDKKLSITAHSNSLGGKLDADVLDEKVKLTFKDLHTIKILSVLGYPKVMDAPINGSLIYNTKMKEGKLDSRFEKARLMPSKMTKLISSLTRNDLSKERFNDGSLVSVIKKDIITSDLYMKSKATQLKSKKFIINSKKKIIDARFAVQIKEYKADILVTQNINTPKVRVDAKSMITSEVKDKAKEELKRFFKKLF